MPFRNLLLSIMHHTCIKGQTVHMPTSAIHHRHLLSMRQLQMLVLSLHRRSRHRCRLILTRTGWPSRSRKWRDVLALGR